MIRAVFFDGVAMNLSASNWMSAKGYVQLLGADRSAFGWEWLRRSSSYRQAWNAQLNRQSTDRPDPRRFGLERFEDPALGAPWARPVWSASADPNVICAGVVDPFARAADRIDLRALSHLVSLAIDEQEIEHLLLSDGRRSIRIDIVEGTLIGCPASLRFTLHGIAKLRGPLATLGRLARLVETGRFPEPSGATTRRHARWVVELRVADAVMAGASHQQIARVLFDGLVADRRWRTESASLRQRVQRLAAGAHASLERPLDRWFA